ncbi:MAG: TMEM165/GDT1 family protein [Kineosporiaceae bacterium]|nr:TMEM165/GDT1 family protein [Kineosporiaceae bacterium]
MDIAVALTTFLLIVPVELPDKTFVATLVLATRYRPLPTWIGVGLAFAVQCLIAVTLGGLLTRLPHRPVTAAAGVLFLVGALVLWRGAAQADTEEAETEQEFEGKLRQGVSGLRAVGASFLVLFLAEWGDLSQLLTAGLVVRYQDPVSVFAGAWLALLLVSGIGAIAGRALLRFVRLSRVRRIGATVCAVLAVLTLLSAAGVPTPV